MYKSRKSVIVAIIYNENRDKVLTSRRDESKHQGGLWEFPGGKAEHNETDWQALSRELHEELGIHAVSGKYYKTIIYDYEEVNLSIKIWFVDTWTGEPSGKEGQQLNWVDLQSLRDISFPPANDKIISMLQLPSLYLITPDLQEYGKDFYDRIAEYLDCGVRLLQFRNPSFGFAEHKPVVDSLIRLCEPYDCTLMYNGTADDVKTLEVKGLHLNSKRLMSMNTRPLNEEYWISTSCHNIEELQRAEQLGLDFCIISPVKQTPSHPAARPMGWENFNALARETGIPVYALGGMHAEDLSAARNHGAHGLAMISAVWNSNDACKAIRKVLETH